MTYILRGKGTQLYGYALVALALIIAGGSAWHGGWSEALRALPISAFIAVFAWVAYGNPRTEVGPRGLRIVNLTRTVDVPWGDLDYVENRWGLIVHTVSGRKISAWSIPSRAGVFENSVRESKQVEKDVDWDRDDDARVPLIVSVRRAVLIIESRQSALKAQKKCSSQDSLATHSAFDSDSPHSTKVASSAVSSFNTLPLVALAGTIVLTLVLWL
ncbi:hypothetical protein JOD55_000682 [Arcanobacterium pluranimalium]|uniref:PH domain-containing protein n=1 Tax=Arcanobacterium pluranimalium TaxID=108028 RepID=UPI001955F836|nr:PH domain-containing protein [Arcanobacterium pluranimalium]MBM7824855.1 hypothetical protein [Arcanobacterium pluranimalium]